LKFDEFTATAKQRWATNSEAATPYEARKQSEMGLDGLEQRPRASTGWKVA